VWGAAPPSGLVYKRFNPSLASSLKQLLPLSSLSRLSPSLALRTVSMPPQKKKKEHTSANLLGAIERHGMGSAIASTPTREMRAELKEAGLDMPSQDELLQLSEKMNKWLEEDRELNGRGAVVTWFNCSWRIRVSNSSACSQEPLSPTSD
jgi:hypothetical protein